MNEIQAIKELSYKRLIEQIRKNNKLIQAGFKRLKEKNTQAIKNPCNEGETRVG